MVLRVQTLETLGEMDTRFRGYDTFFKRGTVMVVCSGELWPALERL
jgi:hypothetical protein